MNANGRDTATITCNHNAGAHRRRRVRRTAQARDEAPRHPTRRNATVTIVVERRAGSMRGMQRAARAVDRSSFPVLRSLRGVERHRTTLPIGRRGLLRRSMHRNATERAPAPVRAPLPPADSRATCPRRPDRAAHLPTIRQQFANDSPTFRHRSSQHSSHIDAVRRPERAVRRKPPRTCPIASIVTDRQAR
ncbi:hypothetical protein I6G56_23010 [Burkholderia humptydooensis]|uniref:Uncharacterized protein n=1 Tax=Burkholderia humptydooensis TaxID=430531 RepID=A0A7T2U7Y9_9BURK|nr:MULTISPECIES: hypothetical protein [Burkholderia]QPS47311.1 hypothetical protein I6G56_23010 [Burkholderia humptydooensis]